MSAFCRLTILMFSVAAAGCTDDPFAASLKPASFANYPVSGNLQSATVADLEKVATEVKPNRIYAVNIVGHDRILVRVTPAWHGSESWAIFRKTHGIWRRATEQISIISATQVLPTGR